MLHPTKGVQHTKNRQHVVDSQTSYASVLRQNSTPPQLQPQDKTVRFSVEQLVKFVANVAIQVAQSQVFYANPTQDAIDKTSSLRRRVFKAAKNHSGVDIAEICLFDAIGQLRPPVPSASNPKPLLPKVKPLQIQLIHKIHQTISHP